MNEGKDELDPATPMRLVPKRQVTFSFALPLDERVDRLVELADEAGASTSRAELLASLVLAAPETADALAHLVQSLRRAKAGDAAVGGDLDGVLAVRRHQPGPRRKSGEGRS